MPTMRASQRAAGTNVSRAMPVESWRQSGALLSVWYILTLHCIRKAATHVCDVTCTRLLHGFGLVVGWLGPGYVKL